MLGVNDYVMMYAHTYNNGGRTVENRQRAFKNETVRNEPPQIA